MSKNQGTKKTEKLTKAQQHAKDRAEAIGAAVGLLNEAKHIAAEIFGRVVEPKFVLEMMPIFFFDDGERDEEDIENLSLAFDMSREAFGKDVGSDPALVLAVYNYFDTEDDDEFEDYEDESEDEDEEDSE